MFETIRKRYQQQETTPQQRYDQALSRIKPEQSVFVEPPKPTNVAAYDENKRLSGLLVSIKDTFDVKGQHTRAGSCLPTTPAKTTAACVEALLADGAVLFGRTNMSEFAFSGLGTNPHYGTPANSIDDTRIAGGSTSGGAISVASGLCEAALGTDTGGSLRIPAAFNGLVGFKPCRESVDSAGCFPLSPSLDTIGAITHNVTDSIDMWRTLTGYEQPLVPPNALNLISVDNIVFEQSDEAVRAAFNDAIIQLKQAGITVQNRIVKTLDDVFAINRQGGLVLPESAWVHEQFLQQFGDLYDPLIAARIRSGAQTPLTTYIERLQQRAILQAAYAQELGQDSLLICPTVAILAPTIAEVTNSAESFAHYNKLALRNTALFNYLDVPSISLPFYSKHGALPIGVMISGHRGQEAALLSAALSIEAVLKSETFN